MNANGEQCTTCEGKGWQYTQPWLEYWEFCKQFPGEEPPRDEDALWWTERGYAITGLPAMVEDCAACQKQVTIEQYVELRPVGVSRFDPDAAFERLMSHYGGI